MARKLSLSPTPSTSEQLSLSELDAREPAREHPLLDLGTPAARGQAGSSNPRALRPRAGPPMPGPQGPWQLPRAVEILDEIITCAVIVLIFLVIALPLFRWIAR